MFGDVWIELEPNPDGGVEFAEKVVGGSVPRNFFPGVEKGIRETAAEGVAGGLPALGLQGDAVRRLIPPGRLERALVQDRGVDGPQGRRHAGQAGPARADHGRRDPHPRDVHGRGQPRPQRPAGTGARDGHRRWVAGDHRPRPAVGAVHLRHGAAVADRRARARSRATLDRYDEMPAHLAEKVVAEHKKETADAGGH